MRDEVARAMTDSTRDFVSVVVPIILPRLGGGEIIPVESVTAESFTKDLDVMAGIDAWHVIRDRQVMRGIASRVQWGNDWQTFSIRIRTRNGNETEYDKRLRAIMERDRGWIFPHLTCQAYLDRKGGAVLSIGIARTEDVIWAVGYGLCSKERTAGDGTFFKAVRWKDLLDADKNVVILKGVSA